MGVAIDTFENLKRVLEESDRDWCLVLLLDKDHQAKAAREMVGELNLFNRQSGEFFDFYLPGYYDKVNPSGVASWLRFFSRPFHGDFFPRGRSGEEAPPSLDKWRFDSYSFELVVDGIKKEVKAQGGTWKYRGDAELLLFQTRKRRGCGEGIGKFATFRLKDLVENGATLNEFVWQICGRLEDCADKDWERVKYALDEVYWGLVSPPRNNPSEEQEKRLHAGLLALGQSYPDKEYVFISYSTKNSDKAKCIRAWLDEIGIPCWMAPDSIPTPLNYAYVIGQAIKGCGLFLGLVSKEFAQSFWCGNELSMALGGGNLRKRVYIASLTGDFDLQANDLQETDLIGLTFSLQTVQIDKNELRNHHLMGLLGRFLALGEHRVKQLPPPTWRKVLKANPKWVDDESFAEKCPWKQFESGDWTSILESAGKERKDFYNARAPYAEWDARNWSYALARCPWLAERCDKWEEFSSGDWVRLLRARPEFAEKCESWKMFGDDDWEALLKERPELSCRKMAEK